MRAPQPRACCAAAAHANAGACADLRVSRPCPAGRAAPRPCAASQSMWSQALRGLVDHALVGVVHDGRHAGRGRVLHLPQCLRPRK